MRQIMVKRGLKQKQRNSGGHPFLVDQMKNFIYETTIPIKRKKGYKKEFKGTRVHKIYISRYVDISSDYFTECIEDICTNRTVFDSKLNEFYEKNSEAHISSKFRALKEYDRLTKVERIYTLTLIAHDYFTKIVALNKLESLDLKQKQMLKKYQSNTALIKTLLEDLVNPNNVKLLDDNLFYIRYKIFSV